MEWRGAKHPGRADEVLPETQRDEKDAMAAKDSEPDRGTDWAAGENHRPGGVEKIVPEEEWLQKALKASTPLQEEFYPIDVRGDAFEVSNVETKTVRGSRPIPQPIQMREACHHYLDSLEQGAITFVPSGIPEVDSSIDGISWGEMCVIAARPSHGKSALALQWLDHATRLGYPSLLISEEMSEIELGKRMVCHISNYHQSNWDSGAVPMLRQAVDRHYQEKAPLFIVENCNSIEVAEQAIDEACLKRGVKVVAVDYLQLLGTRSRSRYEEVSEISRKLKWCAKINNIAMLVACQLNRAIEDRPDFKPRLSDLRESGQIEQDSDLVLLCVWSHRFDPSIPEEEYLVYAAKRRNGPIRQQQITTTFYPDRQRIGPFPQR